MTSFTNEFIYPLRVHIEDTDFTGVVYHANYLNYMERARSEWAHQAGIGIEWQREQGIILLVHSAEIIFKAPARLHDEVRVVSHISSLNKASLTYEQSLHRVGNPEKILCEARIKVACVNDRMKPCALPDAPFLDNIRREQREL